MASQAHPSYPIAASRSERRLRRTFWLLLAVPYVLMVCTGMTLGLGADGLHLNLVLGLILGASVAELCVVHALRGHRPVPYSFRWIILLLWPVAVPVYFVRASGWRGVGFVVVNGLLLVAALFASTFATRFAAIAFGWI